MKGERTGWESKQKITKKEAARRKTELKEIKNYKIGNYQNKKRDQRITNRKGTEERNRGSKHEIRKWYKHREYGRERREKRDRRHEDRRGKKRWSCLSFWTSQRGILIPSSHLFFFSHRSNTSFRRLISRYPLGVRKITLPLFIYSVTYVTDGLTSAPTFTRFVVKRQIWNAMD